MKNSESILVTKDLSIHFGGLVAVDKVNFEVKRNTCMGLIGPNGSGKTTIFNMLTGLYTPTSGDFTLEGESLIGKSAIDISRKGVARTFQANRLCLDLSVMDNVLVGMHSKQKEFLLSALFRPKATAVEMDRSIERAKYLLNIFNPKLLNRVSEPASNLPQIDRRRVEICRAMAMDPKLLLLDEPSAGMTPEEITELMSDIKKVKSESKDITIIIVEHVMSVIRAITDYVVVLNFGKKIAEGGFEIVAQNPQVLEAYLGKRGGNTK